MSWSIDRRLPDTEADAESLLDLNTETHRASVRIRDHWTLAIALSMSREVQFWDMGVPAQATEAEITAKVAPKPLNMGTICAFCLMSLPRRGNVQQATDMAHDRSLNCLRTNDADSLEQSARTPFWANLTISDYTSTCG